METSELIDAYNKFIKIAYKYINIQDEEQYQKTLDEIWLALEFSEDRVDDPINPLTDMLSTAIERYEMKDPEIVAFTESVNKISDIY